jgi:hypothetical protein
MKINKTTYKDKEEIQIGMTADHTSQPDKVLFLPPRIFCFLIFWQPHKWHILFCRNHTTQPEGKTKRATSPNALFPSWQIHLYSFLLCNFN